MKKFMLRLIMVIVVLMTCLLATSQAQYRFDSVNGNIGIEGKSVFTGASLAADFDGEGLNNDVALINQSEGKVIVLLYNGSAFKPFETITIDICKILDKEFIPTSAAAFIDPVTQLQDIAITAINRFSESNGKVLVVVNEGSSIFSNINYKVFDSSSGASDINHADFNNDGIDDLSLVDFRNNSVSILLNDGSNNFSNQKVVSSGGIQPVSAVVGDFNDDDYVDLIVLNRGDENTSGSSSVVALFGDGTGFLSAKNPPIPVPDFGVSMVGGEFDALGKQLKSNNKVLRRMVDFNFDRLPDLAVLSSGGSKGFATVTPIINNEEFPGFLKAGISQELAIVDSKETILSRLSVSSSQGGAEVVSGRGGVNPIGVAGSYHALAVGEFRDFSNPEVALVVSSSFVRTINDRQVTFRAATYLETGKYGRSDKDGIFNIFNPSFLSIGYTKTAIGTTDITKLDPEEGQDTFVAAIVGAFGQSHYYPNILYVSLNGNLWIDNNVQVTFVPLPYIRAFRSELNAPIGQGHKYFVLKGEKASIPITSLDLGSCHNLGIAVFAQKGQLPSFIKRVSPTDSTNGNYSIEVDASNLDISTPMIIRLQVDGDSSSCSGVSGKLPLLDRDLFTLIIRPNNLPAIASIEERKVNINETIKIAVPVVDTENLVKDISLKCDKGEFVSLSDRIITASPKKKDLGKTNCQLTLLDKLGNSSLSSFVINVAPARPIITSVDYSNNKLKITGQNFTNKNTIVCNSRVVGSDVRKTKKQTLKIKGSSRDLNIYQINQIYVISNGEVSDHFYLTISR